MKTLQLAIAHLVLASGTIAAQTILPSVLNCNTTLTAAQSPYLIQHQTTLPEGCQLTVQPGVEIQMADSSNLIIRGKADFLGDSAQPISIHAKNLAWGNIFLDSALAPCTFNYVIIADGTNTPHYNNAFAALDTNLQRATISSYHSSVAINNCTFKNNKRCIYAKYGAIHVNNCSFDSTNVEEKINIAFIPNTVIENSFFSRTYGCQLHDMVDFDGIHNGIIRNNRMYNGEDDGVDLGEWESKTCDTVLVTGNYIDGMLCGKGVSVGERCQHITIEKNVLINNGKGVAVKDNAYALIVNNTFYHDTIGVAVYQKVAGWGGGLADVKNCIIANSIKAAVKADSISRVTVSYSLSNTDTLHSYDSATVLPGTGNLFHDPLFVSVSIPGVISFGDYYLQAGSPCINTGDPASPLDPDNTRNDMGAYYYGSAPAGIIMLEKFNTIEIYPNPSDGIVHIKYYSECEPGLLTIENIAGQTVYSKSIYPATGMPDEAIDLGQQTKGIYFLHIATRQKRINKKIILD